MKRKGQATLEFTFIFVIIVALLLALFFMWKWSTDNIVKRQKWYNNSRVSSGQILPGDSTVTAQATVPPLSISNTLYPERGNH